ncbi:S41 family peptidase [Sphingosinicella sp. CPCC 101087]|uniref:S41 family peptidase n=1 Tax=Sphingosinicella sp. CPCC 101087 TaxID=2497754 RepID=UPI0013ECCCE2|nr:S41 family peptidase [Sphingosinicella sp. CPCC 101087]
MIRVLIFLLMLVGPSMAGATPLTPRDQAAILGATADLLRDRYVDAALGARVARQLPGQTSRWADLTDPRAFASAVTEWLRHASEDGHLALAYSEQPIPEGDTQAFTEAELDRFYGPKVNHGVERIERLDGNVMLLDLRVFPPPSMAADVIAAAMTLVAQGDALIIDLRNNSGGMETANLITGYLLDEPTMSLSGRYERPTDTLTANLSPVWVPGRRFGGTKPLYILISQRTFSAGEAVAYDLQALGRAVVVGEQSGGGANPFEYRRVHPHFALSLPESRSINPITGSNWQGRGVTPDVPTPAGEALDKAVALAKEAIAQGRSGQQARSSGTEG